MLILGLGCLGVTYTSEHKGVFYVYSNIKKYIYIILMNS